MHIPVCTSVTVISVPEVLQVLQDIDETSKRKVEILPYFIVSVFMTENIQITCSLRKFPSIFYVTTTLTWFSERPQAVDA